jgi:hypothetical protein
MSLVFLLKKSLVSKHKYLKIVFKIPKKIKINVEKV